jgi:hypothetical protein
VFAGSCAISASCHSGANPAGFIDLSASRPGASIIADLEKPSAAWPGQGALAVPGMSSASFLVHKVQGDVACLKDKTCGDLMPQTGPKLAAPSIQLIKDWIDQGMKDDLAKRHDDASNRFVADSTTCGYGSTSGTRTTRTANPIVSSNRRHSS